MKIPIKKRARKYYLISRVENTYPTDVKKRTIEVPYPDFESIPKPDRYYIGQLIKFGFNIQHKLF
jgi:hypothetical protein